MKVYKSFGFGVFSEMIRKEIGLGEGEDDEK